ncbi:MAG TPA: valine--tRNA ligase [Peptococcaceae bacterium]|nr:MAG: Valine--tRNA ligase [Clostridia bacterium 41_269]HBT20387.1 valine--tRNA ligase [Peptococcaceae bacterium]
MNSGEHEILSKTYDPKKVEQKWYDFWKEKGFFHAEVEEEKEPFCIVMPPPNVTGSLHLGHALNNTLQDILIRFRRMQGYNTLWLPGTDHAGIATQTRVEEHLTKTEGKSRHDLGREKFLERVWQWKEKYGGQITKQLSLLGCSCDWDRERFTMDEGCSRAVREVFVSLYKKGLIYRGNYIINWCPKCQTTISDIEVEHEERESRLWYVRYPLKDGTGYITVATTRPETILGDTAVAVNPDDERYTDMIGKTAVLPVLGREIPIIADDYVDPNFGTGAVKITPAHDPNDFEVGRRHNLPQITVIDQEGKMTKEAGKYEGMDRYECREQLVRDLEDMGLLVKAEEYTHSVGCCYRCGTVIEPLVSEQWFVKMKPLAEPAIKAALEGKVRFIPERFTKIYLNWLENINDWCISRQLWWGHRIPVWYCNQCGSEMCEYEDPEACTACGSRDIYQDPDVLDTWFSSALWPFSTLGWPEETPELKHFYPTSVLVTGRDIIFFWVARMIFMGLEFMKEVPFHEVFIHGLVLDSLGRKMSKSLGNGVDPIEVIDQYGSDILRFMLVTGNTPGNDIRFHFERLEGTRNFANKIWNASRFALMNLGDYEGGGEEIKPELEDRWILSRYSKTVKEVTKNLENYELGEAARSLYDFIWNEFCDWYIELAKDRLYGKVSEESRRRAQFTLSFVLGNTMKLLHPFMPFITEEIWQKLPHEEASIMISSWPKPNSELEDEKAEEQMNLIMEIIRGIRNIRAEMNIKPSQKVEIIASVKDDATADIIHRGMDHIKKLAGVSKAEIVIDLKEKPQKSAAAVVSGAEIYVPLEGIIDFEVEIRRIEKELSEISQELKKTDKKLSNEGFLKKAPPQVVEKEKNKKLELEQKKTALEERLKMLR